MVFFGELAGVVIVELCEDFFQLLYIGWLDRDDFVDFEVDREHRRVQLGAAAAACHAATTAHHMSQETWDRDVVVDTSNEYWDT